MTGIEFQFVAMSHEPCYERGLSVGEVGILRGDTEVRANIEFRRDNVHEALFVEIYCIAL
jgi:hypothetical protein